MTTLALCLTILVVVWAAHYTLAAVHLPVLRFGGSMLNASVMRQLPQLRTPYRPTPWLYNPHLQLAWHVLRDALTPALRYDHSETLVMDDGGTTSLAWLGLSTSATSPTLVVLHTISGDAQSMRAVVADLHRRTGWRVVVCTRRGHGGLGLTAPVFNTMGSTSDLRRQLEHIRNVLPDSPLFGVGVSAGSGLLTRYLGEEGEASMLRAGAIYCPGYDIAVAFHRAHQFYSRHVTNTLKRRFVAPHAALYGHLPTYQACLAATTLAEFQEQAYEIAGYRSHADYLQGANPISVIAGITVPVLIINADDDPVCAMQNVLDHADAVERIPTALLVRTARGSHCAHFEGWTAKSWAHRLIAGYLVAVHAAQNDRIRADADAEHEDLNKEEDKREISQQR